MSRRINLTMRKRTLFRYYGGKGHVAPWIVRHLPMHQTYVEPFCGAASVLFHKPRCYAEVLNDKDADIINLFAILRDEHGAARLRDALCFTPYSEDEYHSAFEHADEPIERARRFLVRSSMGFFADSCNPDNPCPGFRADVWRRGSIPAHDWACLPEQLGFFIDRLRGVVLRNIDAFDIIRKYDRDDTLFYIDPPYVADTRTQADHHRYRHEMDDDGHRKLVDMCLHLRGMAVVSYYAHPIYDAFSKAGWRIEQRSFFGKNECLAIKERQ